MTARGSSARRTPEGGETRSRRRAVLTALTVLLASWAALAGCTTASSSTTTTSTATSSSTTAPATTTTTVPGTAIDGPEVAELPSVPPASSEPSRPDLSTTAGQTAFLRGVFADIQSTWRKDFEAAGVTYAPARLDLFRSSVSTACGLESAEAGPFYCSGDRTVYLDIQFFAALETQFALSGAFAEAYVVAHELGHHVQNLLGITSRVATETQLDPLVKNALSVKVELQADCFAGVWAHSTYERQLLEPGDVEQALHAAEVVGDDFLAKAGGSSVDPDSFTHGSSAQRQHWFTVGFDEGSAAACDTFAS